MKKFSFKLEGLLRLKKAYEREVYGELMDVQALVAAQEVRIEDIKRKTGDWEEYYNLVMRRGGNMAEMATIDHHIKSLQRYKEQLMIGLDVLQRKRDDVVAQYMEAKKDVKTIDHLRDVKKGIYRAEYILAEQQEADEMAVMRHGLQKEFV